MSDHHLVGGIYTTWTPKEQNWLLVYALIILMFLAISPIVPWLLRNPQVPMSKGGSFTSTLCCVLTLARSTLLQYRWWFATYIRFTPVGKDDSICFICLLTDATVTYCTNCGGDLIGNLHSVFFRMEGSQIARRHMHVDSSTSALYIQLSCEAPS